MFAGAGSHSCAYLPGDDLVTVEPPALGRIAGALRRGSRLLLPWTRGKGTAYGIPFIDYHRGDGPSVGPGEPRGWSPVLIGDETPWVRDYCGLWGLDTRDPFGGERAPAGPRYERDGSVRACWSDPVGWAGALLRAAVYGLPREGPHAHLRRRALPNVYPDRTRTRVLRAWSAISASLLLAGLAVIIYGYSGALLPALGGLAVVMFGTEAFRPRPSPGLRRRAARRRRRGGGVGGNSCGPEQLAARSGRPAHAGGRHPAVGQGSA